MFQSHLKFIRLGGLAILINLLLAAPTWAATIVVNSTADPAGFNPGITIAQLGSTITLRDAVNAAINAGGNNTVTFAPSLAGQTIYLSQAADPDGPSAFAVCLGSQRSQPPGFLTIQGLTGNNGITLAIAGTIKMRHFVTGISDSYLILNDLTITGGNTVESVSGGGWGGAIFNVGAYVNLNRCTLTGNAARFGGAFYVRAGISTFVNCTIVNNFASDQGGGFYLWVGSPTTIINSTIAGNHSGQCGGIFIYSSPYPLLENTIVAQNFSDLPFYLYPDILGRVHFASHNNLCGDSGLMGINNPSGNGAGNMLNGVDGNILGVNALLGSLTNNGGPTPTCALLAGSPAINTGSTNGAPATDQRGKVHPQFGLPDIGAYELTAFDTGQTTINTGGSYWYLGLPALGNDLSIYREVVGQIPVDVGGAAMRIGQANDGSVLVQNASGGVYARIGSTNGVGSFWQLLTAVAAGDGATWFLGADGVAPDSYIYRWATNGAPTYVAGWGNQISTLTDGSIAVRNSGGAAFMRVGSNAGVGSDWQVIATTSPVLTAPTRTLSGAFQFSFTSLSGARFTVLTSTNLTLPLAQWTSLGAPVETPAGTYQFTDLPPATSVQRFYRVTSP